MTAHLKQGEYDIDQTDTDTDTDTDIITEMINNKPTVKINKRLGRITRILSTNEDRSTNTQVLHYSNEHAEKIEHRREDDPEIFTNERNR